MTAQPETGDLAPVSICVRSEDTQGERHYNVIAFLGDSTEVVLARGLPFEDAWGEAMTLAGWNRGSRDP